MPQRTPHTPGGVALAALPLLAGCSPEALDGVALRAERRTVEADAEVSIGDGQPLVLVLSGTLHMRVGTGPYGTMGPRAAINLAGALELIATATDAIRRTNTLSASGRPDTSSDTTTSTDSKKDESAAVADESSVISNLCPHGRSRVAAPRRAKQAVSLPLEVTGGPGGAGLMLVPREALDELFAADSSQRLARNLELQVATWECLMAQSVFPGAPPEVAWSLAQLSERYEVEAGGTIVVEGEVGEMSESLIILEEGEAAIEKLVSGNGQAACVATIASLGAGAVIGDACFVGTRVPRAATVRAITDMQVVRVTPDALLQVLAMFPGLILCIQSRLRETASLLEPSLPAHTDVLATLKLFNPCTLSFVRAVASVAERHVFYCGDTVQTEGSADGTLYVVEFGACSAEKAGEGQVSLISIASCFGEQALLNQSARASVSIRVATPIALLLAVSRAAFNSILDRYPEEQRRFEQVAHLPQGLQRGNDAANLPVFRTCGQKFTEEISEAVELRYYMPGQTATVEGAVDAASMFVIKGGHMQVSSMGQVVKELSTGAIFGEFAMLGLVRRRTATVRAVTLCSMMEVPREKFLQVLEHHPEDREHFEKLTTMHEARATSAYHWSIFNGLPANLLYLVNLYAERQVLNPSTCGQLSRDAAVLVLQGVVKLVHADGDEIAEFQEGHCFNEQVLLGFRPLAGEPTIVTHGEVQVVTKAIFDKILAEFPQFRDRVAQSILHEMANKAEHRLGFARGSVGVLSLSALFRALPIETMEAVRNRLQERVFAPDELIIQRGTDGDTMYFLLDGDAEIETAAMCWRRDVSDPRVFGETVLLGVDTSYTKTLRALDTCVVFTLRRRHLYEVLQNFPDELQLFKALRGSRRVANAISPQSLAQTRMPSYKRMSRVLSETHFFQQTSTNFLDMLCTNAEDVFFAPGEKIIQVGEVCYLGHTPCFILNSGEAVVEDEFALKYGSLRPGDVFGEAGALGLSKQRSQSVRAAKGCITHCSRLHPKCIEAAIRAFPDQHEVLRQLFVTRQIRNNDYEESRRHFIHTTVAPALNTNPIFAALPQRALERLAMPLPEQELQAGEPIVTCGETAGSLVIVVAGEAAVEDKAGMVLGHVRAGALLGEVSILGLLAVRTCTVRATEECRVLRLPSRAIQDFLEEPQAAEARRAFEQLRAERLQQVADSQPFCLLPITMEPLSICSKTICLHATRLSLMAGDVWWPLTDDSPRGAHFSVLAHGRATLVLGARERSVMALPVGQLVPEGLLASYGARALINAPCDWYRICQTDFLLAVVATPSSHGTRCFARFEEAFTEAKEYLRHRLLNAYGAEKVTEQRRPSELVIPARTSVPFFSRLLGQEEFKNAGFNSTSKMLPGTLGEVKDRMRTKILYQVSSGLVAVKEKPATTSKGLAVLHGGHRFFGTAHQVGDHEWLQVELSGTPDPVFSPTNARKSTPPSYSSLPDLSAAEEAWVKQEGTCIPIRRAKGEKLPKTPGSTSTMSRTGTPLLEPLGSAASLSLIRRACMEPKFSKHQLSKSQPSLCSRPLPLAMRSQWRQTNSSPSPARPGRAMSRDWKMQ